MLRPETVSVHQLNDSVMHQSMVRWARHEIDAGKTPLDGWYPYLSLGSPQFHHYPTLSHVAAAYASKAVGVERTYRWSLYLLLTTWPIAVFWAARLFEWDRWSAALAAAVAPLLVSVTGYGFEYGSYVWRGLGMWPQLWAMWCLPLAWATSWRAVARRRAIAVAGLAVGATISLHFVTGCLALAVLPVWAVASGRPNLLRRLTRAAAVGVVGLVTAGWTLLPALVDGRWANYAGYDRPTIGSPAPGVSRVLAWLVTGKLYDNGRLPVVTVLVAIGVAVCISRWRRDPRARAALGALVVTLVLFSAHSLGPLARPFLGTGDLPRRFVTGVHLAGLLLAGIGSAWVGRALIDRAARLPSARRMTIYGGVAVLGLALVAPAWFDRATYERQGGRWVHIQQVHDVTDGAEVAALIGRAKELGGGRVYAGSATNWGRNYTVGFVPVYSELLGDDADAIGFWLRVASLSTLVEPQFNEADPGHYRLFDVRYLLLPGNRPPPVPATLLDTSGDNRLWRVDTGGYIDVGDTTTPISANRTNIGDRMRPYLLSDQPGRGLYPSVAFDGGRPAAVTATAAGSGPPGTVDSQFARPADGVFGARVSLQRLGVIVLKSSFHGRWQVSVDGQQVAAQMIGPSYVGRVLPPGQHTVTFRYAPYPYYGILFALAGLALGASAIADWKGRPTEADSLDDPLTEVSPPARS